MNRGQLKARAIKDSLMSNEEDNDLLWDWDFYGESFPEEDEDDGWDDFDEDIVYNDPRDEGFVFMSLEDWG